MTRHPSDAQCITPDLVEWIVSDAEVARKWKSFAARLNLDAYVGRIDQNFTFRRKKFERQKMKELFDVWRRASPVTFTRARLMDVLRQEDCQDMVMWLRLMNTENSRKKQEISLMMQTPTPPKHPLPPPALTIVTATQTQTPGLATPRSAVSLSPRPGSSASSVLSRQYRSLPQSPYSWYFDEATPEQRRVLPPPSVTSATSANSVASSATPSAGILKKRPASESGASANGSCSDYYYGSSSCYGGGGRNSHSGDNSAATSSLSRESSPPDVADLADDLAAAVAAEDDDPARVTQPLSRLSLGESSSRPPSAVTKSLRFADDVTAAAAPPSAATPSYVVTPSFTVTPSFAATPSKTPPDDDLSAWLAKSPRKGQDTSVEKYFDNLITMIEDAAEGL